MLELQLLRRLTLTLPSTRERPPFLSAASGLVQVAGTLYIVADDEVHLGVFALAGESPGYLRRLFDGSLPSAPPARKRHKPDLEALTLLPPFDNYPHGALLALGSGSKRRRHRGSLLALDTSGALKSGVRTIDCAPLHAELAHVFADLNLEGAAVIVDEFVLLQRGNQSASANAVIRYPLAALQTALAIGDALPAARPEAIVYYDLGAIDGVPLSFTDATDLPTGELLFTAVAEATDNSYLDGACVGAAIGLIDNAGRLRRIERLAVPYKLEGLHAWREGDAVRLLAVTDADDPAVPAALLAGRLPWP